VVQSNAAKLRLLHESHIDMVWMSASVEMYEWYLGDVHQLHISEADNKEVIGCILRLMLNDYVQLHSFDEFCVYAKAQQLTEMAGGPVRTLSRLMAETPSCLRRLLSPAFQLVNKFFQQPLCLLKSKVCLGGPLDGQLWGVQVDPATSLATFQLKNQDGGKLSAQERDVCYSADLAGLWKIKTVDDLHVKIYSENGKNKFFVCMN
jgi:hypothetical protein